MKPFRTRLLRPLILAVLALAVGAALWWWLAPSKTATSYVTAPVTRGDIEQTVIATGTFEARKLVSVGAQVSGRVVSLKVAVGDVVKEGQLIAEIDSLPQQNNLRNAQAALASSKAQRAAQVATLHQAELTFKRQQEMMAADATSRAEFEAAEAALASARANIRASDAQIEQGTIQVDTATLNLGYTKIIAPMDGTVVAVVTLEGQTVNANQSAPTIIKLATLDTLTIKAQISEADVVKVKPGQKVWFTILGEPDRRYHATLRSVEPAPESIASESASSSSSSTSSTTAVYYNGLFDVPNEDGKLRISMTATVNIVLADATDALLVPSSALSAAPRMPRTDAATKTSNPDTAAPSTRTGAGAAPDAPVATASDAPAGAGNGEASRFQRRGRDGAGRGDRASGDGGGGMQQVVQVLGADGIAVEKRVRVGINNNISAQILEGLEEGELVILGQGGNAAAVNTNRRNMGMRPPPGF